MFSLCTSSDQVRNSERAWRLTFPRRQRSVLHSPFPRNPGPHTFPENQHVAAGPVAPLQSSNMFCFLPLLRTHEVNPGAWPVTSSWSSHGSPGLLLAPLIFGLPTRPALLKPQKATEKCNAHPFLRARGQPCAHLRAWPGQMVRGGWGGGTGHVIVFTHVPSKY